MEGFTLVLSLLSGVALFLFGMSLMGDGLKKAAGNKLELILYRLTNTPLKGILLGTAVTAIIQSSSATTVMVVGFVNAGMMKVSQAIGIIMGANIGTSITGWILCLSYIEGTGGIAQLLSTATISAVVAIIGIVFKMFLKKASYHNIGDIMLGFSILMVGMQTMSGAVAPLKSNEHFVNALTMFSNPVMGILVGILFTAVLQSASASVGIMQALSVTGGITFASTLPITMGIGVGAACPVLLSSIGTNKNGRRTALIYLVNDLFGMLFWSVVFYSVHAFVNFGFMDMVMNPVRIALLNTVFRMATILVLSPFIKGIEKFVFLLVRDSEEDKEDQADFDLLEVLTEWNKMPTVEPYRKLDISRYISLISKIREMGFLLTKEQELRAANIPFDETEDALRELFFQLMRRWQQGESVEQPGLPEGEPTLPELEQYCRKLDLYFSFAKAFDCPVDLDKLYDSRERVADEINEILLHRLRSNIRFCDRCGSALPLYHRGRLCDACHRRSRSGVPQGAARRR